MQLEKVTSRSSEAGLAGWIASNDVTLFTMVLVVVIALFLHSKVAKGTRESVQLTGEKATLAANLQSTASELDSVSDLLDRTSQTLQLTQAERDQLQKQLVEKLEQLAQLNAKLDVALKEKGQLSEQRESLLKTKEQLAAQQASLIEERSSLNTTNASLRERLDALSTQLADKIAALEEVEKQRDRLKKQADQLDAIVAALKQKLEGVNVDLAEARGRADAAITASAAKVEELEKQLAAGDKTAEEYLAQLKRATELLQGLKLEKQQLEVALSKAEHQRQLELLEEGRHNRELLGLKGRMQRVAVLVDASGSMRQAGATGAGDRWAEAQAIAAKWLQHLSVEQCVLIVFSSQVRTFPEDSSLADLRGDAGKARREALLQQLKAVEPKGATNTLDALRKAYQYDVDTILLFSDGAPSKADTGQFDPAIAQQIYQLCREHRNIPINTIGLGDYFDDNMATFLQTVAKNTGGKFHGE